MSFIVDTELAPVTTNGTDLYLYYQDSSRHIVETYSSDGENWQQSSQPVAINARADTASPIAAYYVEQDANFSGKSTIHVFYLDVDQKLAEKVKDLGDLSWQDGNVPSYIATLPVKTTHLAAGALNKASGLGPNGSQFGYFHQPYPNTLQITEVRRTPGDPLYVDGVLPEASGEPLPESALVAMVFESGIDLFVQDTSQNIVLYANRLNTWNDRVVVIPGENVRDKTPMAGVRDEKEHLLIVDKSNQIQHYADEKFVDTVEGYLSTTRLGAVLQGNNIVLFYVTRKLGGSIRTKIYQDGAWKDGVQVVSKSRSKAM
ncbi:hypothetical protein DIS24_g8171 [Lasiodiplodia hormozganensis]|uniref:Fucose-specific lectin n=1 Tax=Lasiodiplodia hormozganensis TaxID=869390 RepID=A0AA40CN67_9PEZI|nr:hypothetical protein DIS24_g8171 [Lasiodiplodia hormozganensis]